MRAPRRGPAVLVAFMLLAGSTACAGPAGGQLAGHSASPSGPAPAVSSTAPVPAATTAPVAAQPTGAVTPPATVPASCPPTREDQLGPFYVPGAPVRSVVGSGYVLTGTVRSASGCASIPGARIEFWLANEGGEYDDAHRATVVANERGDYRLETNVPVPYGGRPPHIHVRVAHEGHRVLVTQHYPQGGQRTAAFDLVLTRA